MQIRFLREQITQIRTSSFGFAFDNLPINLMALTRGRIGDPFVSLETRSSLRYFSTLCLPARSKGFFAMSPFAKFSAPAWDAASVLDLYGKSCGANSKSCPRHYATPPGSPTTMPRPKVDSKGMLRCINGSGGSNGGHTCTFPGLQ